MAIPEVHKVGFVGLGDLGAPMACNLLKAGVDLTVHDLRAEAAAKLGELGAVVVPAPSELARRSRFIFIMVRDAAQVMSVVSGPSGVLGGIEPGTTVIVTSTVGRQCVRAVEELLVAKQAHVIDAPVSGGLLRAQQAQLTIMAGASRHVLDRAMPILQAIASTVSLVGDVGAGQAAKLVNNYVLGINILGLLEGLKLGAAAGIQPEVLRTTLGSGSANSFVLDSWSAYGERWKNQLSGRHAQMPLLCKDVGLAIAMAEELGLQLPVGDLANSLCISGGAAGSDDPSL